MDQNSSSFPKAQTYFWVLAILSAVLLLAPIRVGDLAGYDDARYALVAKGILQSGNWFDIRSNGGPALEHPPFFSWMQAVLFGIFGLSDALAKLPSALCGIGVILLTAWLARKLARDTFHAVLAMFVMVGTIYFIKYAARAMTDVPFTFFFLCAVCAWVLAEEDPRWYAVAGLFAGIAQLTRAMMGLSIPLAFAADWWLRRRRIPARHLIAGLALAFVPPAAYYAQWIYRYGTAFFAAHAVFLHDEVYGPLSPSWRRYTGAFEYVWMIAKSYWPWLPAMIAGMAVAYRSKDRRLRLLLVWCAVVFVLCAITRSRVLRYMLPAYPAFSILAAIGILAYVPARWVRTGMWALTALGGVLVIAIAVRPPVNLHAEETRPMALASTAATKPGELITFYDDGVARFDELNQLLWYGDRLVVAVFDPSKLAGNLEHPRTRVFVVDAGTFHSQIEPRFPAEVLAHSGHLVCVRLKSY